MHRGIVTAETPLLLPLSYLSDELFFLGVMDLFVIARRKAKPSDEAIQPLLDF
jgi:hypothetical protein